MPRMTIEAIEALSKRAELAGRDNERERCAKIAEGWIRPNAIQDTIGGAESRAGRLIAAEIHDRKD